MERGKCTLTWSWTSSVAIVYNLASHCVGINLENLVIGMIFGPCSPRSSQMFMQMLPYVLNNCSRPIVSKFCSCISGSCTLRCMFICSEISCNFLNPIFLPFPTTCFPYYFATTFSITFLHITTRYLTLITTWDYE
jgi:hypothetical protein